MIIKNISRWKLNITNLNNLMPYFFQYDKRLQTLLLNGIHLVFKHPNAY